MKIVSSIFFQLTTYKTYTKDNLEIDNIFISVYFSGSNQSKENFWSMSYFGLNLKL